MKKLILSTLLFSLSAFCVAQENPEKCATIESDADRLACYDAIFKQDKAMSKQGEMLVEKAPLNNQAQLVEESISQGSASLTPPEQPTQKQLAPQPALKASIQQVERAEIGSSFGEEKLDKPEEDQGPESLSARVVKVDKNRRGIRTLTLDNGQVWRELEQSKLRIRNDFVVQIQKAALSSYFLSTENSNRRTRVTRIK